MRWRKERKTSLKVSKIHLKFMECLGCYPAIDPGHLVQRKFFLNLRRYLKTLIKIQIINLMNVKPTIFSRMKRGQRHVRILIISSSASDERMWEGEFRVGLERAGVSVGCRLRPQSEASVESTVSEAILDPALPPFPRLSENYSVETKLLSSPVFVYKLWSQTDSGWVMAKR